MTKRKKWFVLILLVIVLPITTGVALAAYFMPKGEPVDVVASPITETTPTFDLDVNRAYTASDGVVQIGAATSQEDPPVNEKTASGVDAQPVSYTIPQEAVLKNGSLGVLTIPALGVSVNVYETDDEMEAMTKGIAHFKHTSAWEGNIGLCGHNINFDLSDGYFKYLYTLKSTDEIKYKTALGTRVYTVQTVAEISENDWSYLERTDDNRITMITCISGKPDMRMVVQAVESAGESG